MVDRDAERMAVDWELADHDRAEFDGRVHQVLQVGRREVERRRPGMELRRDAPVFAFGRLEPERRRPVVESPGPHHRRRHVDVGVRRIDREVGAVERVAEHLVTDRGAAVVAGDHPSIRIRTVDVELAAVAGRRLNVVDVLREIVKRIPSG